MNWLSSVSQFILSQDLHNDKVEKMFNQFFHTSEVSHLGDRKMIISSVGMRSFFCFQGARQEQMHAFSKFVEIQIKTTTKRIPDEIIYHLSIIVNWVINLFRLCNPTVI